MDPSQSIINNTKSSLDVNNPKKEDNSNIEYYIKKAIYVALEEGFLKLLKKSVDFIYRHSPLKSLTRLLFEKGDEIGLINPDHIYNEDYYSKRKKDPYRSESNHIAEVLFAELKPDSVIDFGCGIGNYLEPFYKEGIAVKGVEGNRSAINHSVIPQEKMEKFDLRNNYDRNEKYQLVMSIEVAEHIPEKYSDNFVSSLCDSSDKFIAFTAAPPGQGGTHHVNEQPRKYWIKKFKEHGFEYDEKLVSEIRQKIDVNFLEHVPENLFVFKKRKTQE